ncbi:MAG: hypothetical protein ACOYXM_15750 [Actinomycetota bacterium]
MPPSRSFPRRTVEEALAIPAALKDKNGGNPWATEEVAKALGVARTNNKFFYLTAASRDYGFTLGTRDAAEISLTDLGRKAVYPSGPDAEYAARLEGFLRIEVFQQVLKHFGGSKLPEKEYLANTLQTQFGVDPAYHDEFIELFAANCRYLQIGATFDPLAASGAGAGIRSGVGGDGADTVTVARPTGDGDVHVCFVIMPFVERHESHPPGFFAEVLQQLLTPAATAAGFEVKTAIRQGSDVIQSTIVNDLLDADLVLADLTEHNPNVLFELGMRMAEDKPVVLVRAKGTGQIFDVDNLLRVAEYDPNLWPSTVSNDIPALTEHIKAGWDGREAGGSYLSILRTRS